MSLMLKSSKTYTFTPYVTAEYPCRDIIPAPNLEGFRILLVDDDRDALNFVSLTLRRYGALVTAAHNVDEALQALDRMTYHALLSDIAMPGKDGYELIRRVRARGGVNKRIPAAAFTAFDSEDDLEQVLEAGFHMHLAKPIEAAYLVAAVADLIEQDAEVFELLKQ